MATATLLTLLGIAASASVALYIAYLHRLQIRQIELHRTDPSVPLKPPTHPLIKWVFDYGIFLAVTSLNVYFLITDVRDPSPITKRDIVDISIHVVAIAGNLTFVGLIYIANKLLRTMR